tara:strand:- start:235 stop:1020 length:786 start_codon:yes stop_codon:yes gene_type:complete
MHFSIIINTHNQYQTIERCIKSCLKQNFKKEYEIIIVDTSDKKIKKNLQLLKSKKIKYLHFKKFSSSPEINQIKKISKGIKKSKGKWVCLLDGDDFFNKNKLTFLYNTYNLDKKIIVQDKCFLYNEKTKKKEKLYRKFFLNKLLSYWPEIYGTSCISGSNNVLKSFFKKTSTTKWNFIAIDALLILYATNKNLIKNCNKLLTLKSVNDNNLSLKYNFYTKLYWDRRNQQIDFWEGLTGRKIYNFDKVLSRFINLINKSISV